MVKIFQVAILALLCGFSGSAQYNTVEAPGIDTRAGAQVLPIYSNTLIETAPAGTVEKGIRNCYSAIMKGGISYRDFEKGVLGEYVMGDDGNLYLRKACYQAGIDTYLKLEKVDETTYVAHTPQLIWVDELSDGSLFTAYATRVVFSQKSATSFGYELQQLPEGGYDTDIYFTLTDGVLRQMNMATTEMNGEIFPEELVGFTTSAGGWIGFGDGCIEIAKPSAAATALPEGITPSLKSLDFNILHVRDIPIDNAVLVKYAEKDDEVYISNPSSKSEQWVKGVFDRQEGTLTFTKQFLGIDQENGYAVWFMPAKYDKELRPFYDDDPDYGDWYRTYEPADKLVFKDVDGVLTSSEGYALFFSHDSEELLETGVYAQPCIRKFEEKSSTPSSVTFTKFEAYDDLWGFGVIGFGIPCMDTEGVYIPSDELFYSIYPDDSDTPYVFSSSDYIDMEVGPMTEVPYSYFEDFDFKVNGVNHTVYFYHDWKKVGVQVIRKHDDVVTRSRIVYSDGSEDSSIEQVGSTSEKVRTRKYVKDGELIILHNGERFNSQGIKIK